MNQKLFSARHHIPRYSLFLLQALKTPLLLYFSIAGNIIMFGCAGVFHYFEYGVNLNVVSYFDSLWWALCTVSTVGYGDIAPMTTGGRMTGMFLIVIGITFFLSFMAVLVAVLDTRVRETDDDTIKINQLSAQVAQLQKQIEQMGKIDTNNKK